MRTDSLARLWTVLGLLVLLMTAAVGVATAPVLARTIMDSQLHVTKAMLAQAAAEQGDTVGLQEMLRTDPHLVNCRDPEGWTPLHEAARGGYVGLVKLLLAEGADINAKTDAGFTALRCATAAGEKKAAEALLAAGAK